MRRPPPRTERAAVDPARLFVDSGAWIALQNRRDQHHAEADRLFREAVQAGIRLVTTNLVLAEVHRLTLFRVGIEAASRALDRIDASPSVTVHFAAAEDHAAARRWLERLAPRPVTYADAVSFAVIETTGCTHVLGFDSDFEAAGFQ
ncbi:MAG: type II toxin-antitoxin system VapC family toxin, partial [Candidatus Rokuibacteriota bacterium]